jgi:hypothetical protein
MADKGWQRAFDDPIPLPRGRQLITFRGSNRRDHRACPVQPLEIRKSRLEKWASPHSYLLDSR